MQKQTNFIRTQVRLPPAVHQELVNFADEHDYSLNSAIIELVRSGLVRNMTGLHQKEPDQRMSLFCGHYNGENYEVSMKFINDFFKNHPEYNLINLQVRDDNCGIYYFYEIPAHEDKRGNF